MALRVEVARGRDALTELLLFRDRALAGRPARWPTLLPLDLPLLLGESPFSMERRFHPLVARNRGEIVARAVATIDGAYQRFWDERLGHVLFFDALPGTREAVRALMNEACEWLAAAGAVAARVGMGLFDMPLVIDAYEALPPTILRENPPHYHALLKDAGFETERGFADYRIAVDADLVARWERMVAAGRRRGYRLVPFGDVPAAERAVLVADLLNDAFRAHFGYVPTTPAEQALIGRMFEATGYLETSFFAYEGDRVVGQVYVVPETSAMAAVRPGWVVPEEERLNFLGIGVRAAARGRGVNLALAAASYLALVRRGATHLSYTLVLDDNWPSRRTAEKLGAAVCASYVCYRRSFPR
ncbi:MAG TPA: GNAT family N-acetyltransferase [Candidatus Binatia bacterium]|nr:GNAT family N-acetyltransferase [Candidatus Binatia bacterium]